MLNDCPAIVRKPKRVLIEVFGATMKLSVPLPVPLALDVIVTHESVLLDCHAQSLAKAVTLTEPLPPAAPKLALLDDRVNEHCGRWTDRICVVGADHEPSSSRMR